jgi:ribonucleotide monophosphatase NagD (HAD superfamily)
VFEAALRRSGGSTPLVIGDRLDTDIAGANALGWDSMLVLSGVSTEAELPDSPFRPTYVARDVRALLDEDAVERVGGASGAGDDQK